MSDIVTSCKEKRYIGWNKSQRLSKGYLFWILPFFCSNATSENILRRLNSHSCSLSDVLLASQLNIDVQTRKETENRLSRPDSMTFDPAQEQVLILMETDSYRRFLVQSWNSSVEKEASKSAGAEVGRIRFSFPRLRFTLTAGTIERRRKSIAAQWLTSTVNAEGEINPTAVSIPLFTVMLCERARSACARRSMSGERREARLGGVRKRGCSWYRDWFQTFLRQRNKKWKGTLERTPLLWEKDRRSGRYNSLRGKFNLLTVCARSRSCSECVTGIYVISAQKAFCEVTRKARRIKACLTENVMSSHLLARIDHNVCKAGVYVYLPCCSLNVI